MDIQKTIRRGLVTTLALSLGAIAACADIYSAPLRGGERCARCDRVLDNTHVAGEIISTGMYVAYPFRTIRCLLTYLREADVPSDRIMVADYATGRLMPVRQAHFVRVPIPELSGDGDYGMGDFDYVAFRSAIAARRFAERHGTVSRDWTSMRRAEGMVTFMRSASR